MLLHYNRMPWHCIVHAAYQLFPQLYRSLCADQLNEIFNRAVRYNHPRPTLHRELLRLIMVTCVASKGEREKDIAASSMCARMRVGIRILTRDKLIRTK